MPMRKRLTRNKKLKKRKRIKLVKKRQRKKPVRINGVLEKHISTYSDNPLAKPSHLQKTQPASKSAVEYLAHLLAFKRKINQELFEFQLRKLDPKITESLIETFWNLYNRKVK